MELCWAMGTHPASVLPTQPPQQRLTPSSSSESRSPGVSPPTTFAGQRCQTLPCLKVDPTRVKSFLCFTAKGTSFYCIVTRKCNKSLVSKNRKQPEFVQMWAVPYVNHTTHVVLHNLMCLTAYKCWIPILCSSHVIRSPVLLTKLPRSETHRTGIPLHLPKNKV